MSRRDIVSRGRKAMSVYRYWQMWALFAILAVALVTGPLLTT